MAEDLAAQCKLSTGDSYMRRVGSNGRQRTRGLLIKSCGVYWARTSDTTALAPGAVEVAALAGRSTARPGIAWGLFAPERTSVAVLGFCVAARPRVNQSQVGCGPMPSTIHFTSGEAVTVTTDAQDVVDQLGKGKEFTRFELLPVPVFKVYVASDEVAYVASIPTAHEFADWVREEHLD